MFDKMRALCLLWSGFIPHFVFAQSDTLPTGSEGDRMSYYVGAGPLFAFGPVYLNFTGGVVFRSGWGVTGDFIRYKDRIGTVGVNQTAAFFREALASVRVVREFSLPDQRFRLHVGLGPSFGRYKNTYRSEVQAGFPEITEEQGNALGVGAKINLVYRVNRFIGVSGGINLGFNSVMHVNGPEAALLLGRFGASPSGRAPVRKPLELYTYEELKASETRSRRQSRGLIIAGSILTAAAVATNIAAVKEYHGNDTFARLGGTVGFAVSHLALAPAGTSLLSLGFAKRGKSNALRKRM